jgi:hypothetical protein
LHQVGDLFELNVKVWCQKVKSCDFYVSHFLMQTQWRTPYDIRNLLYFVDGYVYLLARAVKIVYISIAGEFLAAVQVFASSIFLIT